MAYTTRTEISEEVNNYYDRSLLERLLPNLVYTRFAQVKDIPRKAGSSTIKFRKYSALSAATTALTEGTTPTATALSVTDITATVLAYGSYVTVTDVVDYLSPDPVLTEASQLFGEQSGDTLDQLTRDVLAATTTIQYGDQDGATARGHIDATCVMDSTEVKKAVRTLGTNNAKKLTTIINPDDGYNTSPINAAYIGIIGPKTLYDLKAATNWVPVEKYANKADVMTGEAGALDEVRFIVTSNAKVYTSEGSGSADVHATIILGANAYGISRISGEAIKNIVKPLGSAGSADPLDQRATSGWKATFVARILDQNALIKVEHGVTG